MRTLPVIVLLVMVLTLPGCQTVEKAKSEAEAVYMYTDWSYGTLDPTNGIVVFYGKTTSQREGSATKNSLFVNTRTDRCTAPYFRIAIELENPSNKDFTSQPFQGTIRLDDQTATPFTFVYFVQVNKKYVWVDCGEALSNKSFVDQFVKSQMVQFNVSVEKTTYKLRFTLRNHIKAITTAMDNCKEATAFKAGTPAKPSAPAKVGDQDDDARYFKK